MVAIEVAAIEIETRGVIMRMTGSRGPVRKLVTRVLAAGALLCLYTVSTGVVMTTGITSAVAQRGRGRGRGRGWIGPAIGLGVGAAIVGGAIAAEEARRREGAVEYCMRRFRSYNPETGTYIGRDGFEHPCP
jgi:hypothetical protein